MVVEFTEMTERLRGEALGTEGRKAIHKHPVIRGTFAPCECKGLNAESVLFKVLPFTVVIIITEMCMITFLSTLIVQCK